MSPEGRVILAKGIEIPDTVARITEIDFKTHDLKRTERALAALALLARTQDPITLEMLDGALQTPSEVKLCRLVSTFWHDRQLFPPLSGWHQKPRSDQRRKAKQNIHFVCFEKT